MNRAFTNILSEDVERSAVFYETLLGLHRSGNFGWFVLLSHDNMPGFELGILSKAHETVPPSVAKQPTGGILTFVVDDLDAIVAQATKMDAHVLERPTDMPYGQRRLLLRDPDGVTVDISAPIR